ncbi:competence protein ComG [Lysinibacillus alkalisoli]|uniref:Competence protein ComG n=1 Tax=Lysinibacillus alkalisoli TaxID=1911548 RepID=A0A917LFE4_9BACI|nr:competence type IV pilus assembly protein ComGB [Lysinibacillus alkalisoli]GGG17984.1 competence protein ComG [Lysinibacillus alkalisoli]
MTANVRQHFLKWRQKRQTTIQSVPTFFRKLQELLAEGYPFHDALSLLLPYHVKDVQLAQRRVEAALRDGLGVAEVLQQLHLPSVALVSLTIAEKDGQMLRVLQQLTLQFDMREKLARKLKQTLLYPIVLLVFLIGMFFIFRTVFFPKIVRIVESRDDVNNSVSLAKKLLYMPDILLISMTVIIVFLLLFRLWLRTKSIARQLQIQKRIPFWHHILATSLTRQLTHHLGHLLHAGISLQDSLILLKQQHYHHYLQYLAQELQLGVREGDSITQMVMTNPYILPQLEVFVTHGEHHGLLSKELLLYSSLLDEQITRWLERSIALVQPVLFMLVALCIIAAYISLLLPIYNMMTIY